LIIFSLVDVSCLKYYAGDSWGRKSSRGGVIHIIMVRSTGSCLLFWLI